MSSEFARHLTHLTLRPLTNVTAVGLDVHFRRGVNLRYVRGSRPLKIFFHLKKISSQGQNLAVNGL